MEFADRWTVWTIVRPNKGVLKKWRSVVPCGKRSRSWDKRGLQGAGLRVQGSRHRAEDIMEATMESLEAGKLRHRETVTSPLVKLSQPNQLSQLKHTWVERFNRHLRYKSIGRNKICLINTNAGPAGIF